ncbi:hypothetical protein JXK06_00140 [Patescibacteria group bacterium]|nr:hypothetical protein [Patescibacteria group bacterium]
MPENYHLSKENSLEEKTTKTRKLVIFIFTIVGVFLLFLSFQQLKNNIYDPFSFAKQPTENLSTAEADVLSSYVLQTTDTDGDELSDYDELYIYSSSPFLTDTDSDGITDYDEVINGSDPLCAEGQDCDGLSDPSFVVSPDLSELTEVNANASSTVPVEDLAIVEDIISGQADPAFLRNLLLTNGFSEEELNGISDEDLQAAYFEVVSEQLSSQQEEINNQ